MARKTINWKAAANVDIDTLKGDTRKQYAAFKDLAAKTSAARDTFNTTLVDTFRTKAIPVPDDTGEMAPLSDGETLVIGHNFGRLSVVRVEDEATPSARKAQTIKL